MFKILQAKLQQYVNWELSDVQAGFRKGRGTRDQFSNNCWIIENAWEFHKNIDFFFKDYTKAFDLYHKILWKTLKEIGILNHFTCLLKNMYVAQETRESDMEQLTGSELKMECHKAVYCYPAYLTSMQSTSCKILDWMNHKLESRFLGKI